MKVLMISTDRKIFEKDSEVRSRLLDYGKLFDELQVIVFAKKELNLKAEQLAPNVFICPTNSNSKLAYIFDGVRTGKNLIKNGESWVITSQDPFETGLVAWWLKKKKRIKWQAQIHTDFLSSYFIRESLLNWLRAKLAGFLLPKADGIRVVSERIKQSLTSWHLKTEPIVLPIYVPRVEKIICDDKEDLHQKYPQFSFVILMASRLTLEKNFSLALEAFTLANNKKSGLGLIIVGSGPEKSKLQELTKKLDINKSVIFEDWNSNLICYYQTADLFMLTSNYEGYGRTLVEAGLNGCPVLTTDIGLVGELVNDQDALVCPVADKKCLTGKIIWAKDNKNALITSADKLKEDLQSILINGEEYLGKYKKLLEQQI